MASRISRSRCDVSLVVTNCRNIPSRKLKYLTCVACCLRHRTSLETCLRLLLIVYIIVVVLHVFHFCSFSPINFMILVKVDIIVIKMPHTCLRSKNGCQFSTCENPRVPILPIFEICRFFTEKFGA